MDSSTLAATPASAPVTAFLNEVEAADPGQLLLGVAEEKIEASLAAGQRYLEAMDDMIAMLDQLDQAEAAAADPAIADKVQANATRAQISSL